MYVIVVRFKVRDFEEWKNIFESRIPLREKAGCLSSRAFQKVDEPNTAVVILEWDDLDRYYEFAKIGFAQNPQGNPIILDKPDIYVLRESGA